MKDKIQELYDTVDRYKGFSFMPLWTLDKISKLTEELIGESRKYINNKDYDIKDVIDYLNRSDYTILTNNGYKVVLDDDRKIYVQNYSGDMKKISDSLELLKEDEFLTCDYILDRCEDWQI